MLNPSKREEMLNSPVARASEVNDPQFQNQQGYFNYDLTHQEFTTPLFGQVTPTMHLDTVPGDRIVVSENTKLILNQIQGNFLSQINQYVDSFYVPLRNVMPVNYEKMIPNPVKGMDIPNSALPQVPLLSMLRNMYSGDYDVTVIYNESDPDGIETFNLATSFSNFIVSSDLLDWSEAEFKFIMSRLLLVSTVISRGQLLDYLGFQLDTKSQNTVQLSKLQYCIDTFMDAVYDYVDDLSGEFGVVNLSLVSDTLNLSRVENRIYGDKSEYRSMISDALEAGKAVILPYPEMDNQPLSLIRQQVYDLLNALDEVLSPNIETNNTNFVYAVDEASDPFADGSFINIGKVLAYQQIIAQYYSNDHVDNIFSSDLFMQLLRGVMFPSDEDVETSFMQTVEPTFDYNGVATEYDYISCGAFFASLIWNEHPGVVNRQYVWTTIMLLLRRSLRYGDYFSTARPNMLAVSDQLGINVENGMVSPIDVTKNLLMQRYLNSANYIGQGFLQYMTSEFGVRPSDTGCIPRFISHRKIAINNQVTNNTANEQGKQTTNLVGYTDNQAYDVFIDDFGYILNLTSFDVLPVYSSGVDNCYHLADRFDYFNPLLQNIGDQPIRMDELIGSYELHDVPFGWTMRNAEYKFKLSKSHGAFTNSLAGFMLKYPLTSYLPDGVADSRFKINPDFIRDKASYLDPVIYHVTGLSPANYYHFVCSHTNIVKCARKIQATPPVLF